MPSLTKEFLQQLKDDYSQYPVFIETGTAMGDTTFAMEPLFESLHTIEYAEKYYNIIKNSYKGHKINFIHGDSGVVFETLLPTITQKAIFFLDGHWSSGDTGKSKKDCPLNEEVMHIQNLFEHEAIIIIDDTRLFGLGPSSGILLEDWTDIQEDNLLNILKSRTLQVYHLDWEHIKNDRLIIHIAAKNQ